MTTARLCLACCCALALSACEDEQPGDNGNGNQPPRPVQLPLAGNTIPQFAQSLPTLSVAGGTMPTLTGNQPLTIRMCEFWANVLPPGTLAANAQPKTRVWGYVEGACPANGSDDAARDTFIGPVIISKRSQLGIAPEPPTTVSWVNDLGTTASTQVLAYKLSTDLTVHWANPNGVQCPHGEIPIFGSTCANNYQGPIPAVVHLHGGEVPPAIDGGPQAWFLSQPAAGYQMHGPAYYSKNGDEGNRAVYAYPNVQEAAPLWFHDHTLGATRLNVYAGLAGGYLIIDPTLTLPSGMTATGLTGPNGSELPIIPLVVQDRAFDTNGQLFYPADNAGGIQFSPNPQHPYWAPESFTDTIVVNGKVWPFLEVEPKRYRFLLLDGANARAFALAFVDQASGAAGPPIWVIGTEEGYTNAPVRVGDERLTMMPGERYDVIVDFSGWAPGSQLVLTNTAATPFPDGDAPDPTTTGRVLQIRVGACNSGACGADDPSYNPASGTPILTGDQRLVRYSNPETGELVPDAIISTVRQLTLNEILLPASTANSPVSGVATNYPGGSLQVLLNNTMLDAATTEVGQEGTTELWEIVNLTMDAHPIHTHLTDLQIVNRQDLDVAGYLALYQASFPAQVYEPGVGPPLSYQRGNPNALGGNPDITPFLTGAVRPPALYESSWKDTVVVPPGQVTRFVVRFASSSAPVDANPETLSYPFDPSGAPGYVWHCHIISHEDNEMMRPSQVTLNSEAPARDRSLILGRDY